MHGTECMETARKGQAQITAMCVFTTRCCQILHTGPSANFTVVALFKGPSGLEMSLVQYTHQSCVNVRRAGRVNQKKSAEKMFRAAAALAEEAGDSC